MDLSDIFPISLTPANRIIPKRRKFMWLKLGDWMPPSETYSSKFNCNPAFERIQFSQYLRVRRLFCSSEVYLSRSSAQNIIKKQLFFYAKMISMEPGKLCLQNKVLFYVQKGTKSIVIHIFPLWHFNLNDWMYLEVNKGWSAYWLKCLAEIHLRRNC